ncbi:hypothetical protein C8Q72DRAFT_175571 [Fomitopsis betulina]|nr:hypothetical protein C8Q72DRAFT_175571 [Fomitopsis betulina]
MDVMRFFLCFCYCLFIHYVALIPWATVRGNGANIEKCSLNLVRVGRVSCSLWMIWRSYEQTSLIVFMYTLVSKLNDVYPRGHPHCNVIDDIYSHRQPAFGVAPPWSDVHHKVKTLGVSTI